METIRVGRWDWILFSIIVATLGGLGHWLVYHLATARPQRAPKRGRWGQILQTIESPWLQYPLRVIYTIGIPLAALIWQGALTPRGLGLKPLPFLAAASGDSSIVAVNDPTKTWGHDIGWSAILATATIIMIILGDHAASRQKPDRRNTHGARSLSRALIDAIVYQTHWAFYKEPFVVNWGIAVGSWLGTIPVIAETAVNLMFWERMRSGSDNRLYMRQMLIRGGLLAASSQLYLKTQNIWLAILMDVVIGWLLLPNLPRSASIVHQSSDHDNSLRVDPIRVA